MKLRESIFVIGEGLTEKHYYQHLRKLKSYNYVIRPRFFSSNNCIYYLEKHTEELLLADVMVICAFDADVARRNAIERKRYRNFIKKYRNNENVIICDSLPSIEFWFLLHYRNTNKYFQNYKEIRNELRKYIPNYDKAEKFLCQEKWAISLIKKQDFAIENGKKLDPDSGSYSNIFKSIEFFEKNN